MPISVRVVNVTSGNFSYYLATNISTGGMFLKSDEPLAEGTDLTLRFALPYKEENIQVDARVVRSQKSRPGFLYPSGMGIKFTALEAKSKDAIQEFINWKT